jgi:hypothetical protein
MKYHSYHPSTHSKCQDFLLYHYVCWLAVSVGSIYKYNQKVAGIALERIYASTSQYQHILFKQAAFPELLKFPVCIFVEIVISNHPSRAIMRKSESLGRLPVESVGTNGNLKFSALKFSCPILVSTWPHARFQVTSAVPMKITGLLGCETVESGINPLPYLGLYMSHSKFIFFLV